MLDILIPFHLPNAGLVRRCIEAIDRHRPGMTTRIVLGADGLARGDCGDLREWLRKRKPPEEINPAGKLRSWQVGSKAPSRPPDWVLVEWPGPLYLSASMQSLIRHVREEYVFICPPWIEVNDSRWLGKLQQPFTVDPRTMMVALPEPGFPQGDLPPAQMLARRGPASEGFLTRRVVFKDIAPKVQGTDSFFGWATMFAKIADQQGGHRWIAQGVRYLSREHEPHQRSCPQPDSSETPGQPSELPSPTTPVSSTATTTEKDGSGDFVPF